MDSRGVWLAKTIGLVVLVAVAISVASTAVQLWLTGKSNGAISGGASGSAAVVAYMAMKKRQQQEAQNNQRQPRT
jgi:hypothetical protein